MQNFIEIHQRNPELLSSGGFRPPPRLDRGIKRTRLDRVKAVDFGGVCTGPTDTFFSFDGRVLSAIDLVVVPRALIPYVNWAYVFEKEAENLPDHVPVAVSIKLSVLKQSIDLDADFPCCSRKHIS